MLSNLAYESFLLIIRIGAPLYVLSYLAFSVWKGELKIRGGAIYRKDEDPSMFWISVGLLLAIGAVWLVAGTYRIISS